MIGAAWRQPAPRLLAPVSPGSGPVRLLNEAEAKAQLASFGVPVPRGRIAGSADAAAAAAADIGYPVALKALGVAHKTEAGALRLNLRDDRAVREARSLPFAPGDLEEADPAVDVRRFRLATEPYPGGWRSFPTDWRLLPETRLVGRETLDAVAEAIAGLPDAQRMVVTLRDVLGCPAGEVCEALDITPGNQRVLLHRGRARLRAGLEGRLRAP